MSGLKTSMSTWRKDFIRHKERDDRRNDRPHATKDYSPISLGLASTISRAILCASAS